MEQQVQPELEILRIYLKDASLEMPEAPAVFMKELEPEVNVDLQVTNTPMDDDNYDVVLTVTVHAKEKDKTAFLIEVHQAAIFRIKGFPEEDQGHILGAYCPSALFPYAREVVSDLISKASLPQFVLAPINFEAMYMQQQMDEGKDGKGEKDSGIILN